MAAVRIKLYGLVSMTRGRYLTQLVVALIMAAVLLGLWWVYWGQVRTQLEDAHSPILDRVIAFWNIAPYVILGIVALQILEAYIVLRRFEQKEAEAKSAPPV